MKPAYKDALTVSGYIIWLTRDKAGKVTEMHVGGSRIRDMLFTRISK
ncbi:MAG: hypothetical protein ABI539_10715 [Acidobacteriota bacterium]